MIAGVAQFVMALALNLLPQDRRDWGRAMQAEFDAVLLDGKPLGFALGCLWAGWRRLPFYAEGRIALASYMLALGLIVPIATFHLGCAVSAGRLMLSGHDHYFAMLSASGGSGRVAADSYRAAAPALTMLLLLLSFTHLLIAWAILEGRWRRISALWLVGAVIAVTIVGTIAMVAPSVRGSAIQLAALAIELVTVPLLALWQHVHAHSPHSTEVR